ncbi:MAG: GGDEF domain-containing protein [Candidatus Eremiobacteraeota bacterium]|nr:GGDEF domain-containing protein [Candidatus Eremiobacteraeota bacterium]
MKVQGPEPGRNFLSGLRFRATPKTDQPQGPALPSDGVKLSGGKALGPSVGKLLAVGGVVAGCVAGAVTFGPMGLLLTAAGQALAFASGLLMSRAQKEELEEANRELLERATTDPLTGLRNRGAIFEILEEELERSRRQRTSLSVILCDVDHFKKINDNHGHPCGDAVLQEVARRLAISIRAIDSPGRYGGEEMLVVLPGASSSFAVQVAERIRSELCSRPIDTIWGSLMVSMSLGVAGTDVVGSDNFVNLIQAADQALYRAKQGGRNRVESAGGTSSEGWQLTAN